MIGNKRQYYSYPQIAQPCQYIGWYHDSDCSYYSWNNSVLVTRIMKTIPFRDNN